MTSYRPIAKYSYGRRVKALKPGKVQSFKLHGKRVKAYAGPDGRTLEILEAPKGLIPDPKKYKLMPEDGMLRPVPIEKPRPRPEPAPAPIPAVPPAPIPEPPPPSPAPAPVAPPVKKEEPKPPKPADLSDPKMRRKAQLVPVPPSGPIPTPFINWDDIPEECNLTEQARRGRPINYIDYPIAEAPNGLLQELRNQFRINRLYQDILPPNVWIRGPPGTGKSQVVKKFAEESGLPYWGVIGRQGIKAEELIGHWEPNPKGGFDWIEGIIPKAVKAGGILHFDEPNVIDPATLMRLDELMDNKRQLKMEERGGELVKAHPDLYIIFTSNPETFEGVKNMPDPIRNRLIKKYYLDYPPEAIEHKIIESNFRAMGVKSDGFSITSSGLKGKYAEDVTDFLKFSRALREYRQKGMGDLSYVPSVRDTLGFIQDLRAGKDFVSAVRTNVLSAYTPDPEEYHRVEEVLGGVRR